MTTLTLTTTPRDADAILDTITSLRMSINWHPGVGDNPGHWYATVGRGRDTYVMSGSTIEEAVSAVASRCATPTPSAISVEEAQASDDRIRQMIDDEMAGKALRIARSEVQR